MDNSQIVKEFQDYIKYIYGTDVCDVENPNSENPRFFIEVPGELKRVEFEDDVKEFCEKHNCSFELIDQAPDAPSRQFFSENMKLMYPDVKSYEMLEKQPRKLRVAKDIFKEQWGAEFDPESEEDREDIVLLYNEYMEELREWKPVEMFLHLPKEEIEEEKMEVDVDDECKDAFENEMTFQVLIMHQDFSETLKFIRAKSQNDLENKIAKIDPYYIDYSVISVEKVGQKPEIQDEDLVPVIYKDGRIIFHNIEFLNCMEFAKAYGEDILCKIREATSEEEKEINK